MAKIDSIYIIPIILISCLLFYLLLIMFLWLFKIYDEICAKRKINYIQKYGEYKYEKGSISGIFSIGLSRTNDAKLQNGRKEDGYYKNEVSSKEISGEDVNKEKIDHLKSFREKYIFNLTEEEKAASIRRIYDSDYMKDTDSQD